MTIMMLADTSGSDPGTGRGNSFTQCEASGGPHAKDYVPGSKRYPGLIGYISRSNPRKNKTVAQWLHEWEQEWDAMTTRAGNNG